MFEDLVSNLLSSYLGDYLEGLSTNDLKLSLWKGDVELKNLVIQHILFNAIESEDRSAGFPESAHPGEERICGIHNPQGSPISSSLKQ